MHKTFDHGGFFWRSHAQMSNNDKLKLKRMKISTLKNLVYWLVLHSSMPAGTFIAEILQARVYSGLPGKNITALSGKRCCIVLTLVSSASVDCCTVVGPFQAYSRIQQACCVYWDGFKPWQTDWDWNESVIHIGHRTVLIRELFKDADRRLQTRVPPSWMWFNVNGQILKCSYC